MTETKVLVNQVGYDLEKEKVFILQAEEGMAPGKFEVLGKGGTVAYNGQLYAGTDDGLWVLEVDGTTWRPAGRLSWTATMRSPRIST